MRTIETIETPVGTHFRIICNGKTVADRITNEHEAKLICFAPLLADACFSALSILALSNCPDSPNCTAQQAFEQMNKALASALLL